MNEAIPNGYTIGRVETASNPNFALASRFGLAPFPTQWALEWVIPAGAKVRLDNLSFRFLEVGVWNQVFLTLLRNGFPLSPFVDIPATFFELTPHFSLNGYIGESGRYQVLGKNLAGASNEEAGQLGVPAVEPMGFFVSVAVNYTILNPILKGDAAATQARVAISSARQRPRRALRTLFRR